MTDFLVKIKHLSIITIISSVVIGLILIIKPNQALQIVSLLCGAVIILLGVGSWIYYFARDNSLFLAVMGTLALVVGIIVCVRYKSIISFFLIILGAFLIISGVVDLISALSARKSSVFGWVISLVMALAVIILGIIITVNPFSSMIFVTRLLGVSLIIYAIVDLISFFQISRVAKLKTVVDHDVAQVDITNDDIE